MKYSWNRGEDGVITVYAHMANGKVVDVADFWLSPLVKIMGTRSAAKSEQQALAEMFCEYMNRPKGWVCPIGLEGCKENCGSYGCGN